MWRKIAVNILRNRLYYLIALGIWAIILGVVLYNSKIQFTRNNAQLLPSDNETMVHLTNFTNTFGSEENLVFIGINATDLQTDFHFNKWINLLQQIQNIHGVKNLLSIGDALVLKKDTVTQSFYTQPINKKITSKKDFTHAIKTLNQFPFYKNLIYNPTTKAIQNVVYLDTKIVNTQEREKVVFMLQNYVNTFKKTTKIPVYTSGMPLIRTMNAKEVKTESFTFILAALFITCLIFTLIFRSLKATFTAIIIVLMAVVSSFATMAIFNFEITLLTALVPPLLIVIGIPNCIFLLNKYFQEYQNHQNKPKALVRTIVKIGNATLLTNFTTAFGFFTFVFTNSETLKEFGIVASINIMLVFIYSILIIPIAYSYFKAPKKQKLKHLNSVFMKKMNQKLVYLVTTQRKKVFAISILLLLLSIIGISLMKKSANMLDDMSKRAQFYKDISFFDDNFGGVLPLEIIIEGKPNFTKNLGTLKRVQALYNSLDSIPTVGKPLSILNGVKFSKQAFYNGNPEYYNLPSTYEKSFVFKYLQNTKGENNMLKNYVDSTQSKMRITTLLKNEESLKLEQSIEKIEDKIQTLFPNAQTQKYLTGVAYVFMEGTKYLTKNLMLSLALAILLISVFMAFMFRSFKMILFSLIPNFLPLFITAGCMGYFGIPIKPSTILVFSIAFGIAVDDTIHFLAKYRQEMNRFPDIESGVLSALKETSNSMFYSSVVLFCGFSVFLFSGFQGIVALGGLVAVTLFFAVLSNLILLPSLLLSVKGTTDKEFLYPDINMFDEDTEPLLEEELKELNIEEE